ncbi:Gfo/Idh/MocA family oxidoreductase [Ottowia sp. GY511]|uniref:Gfo/Idh/MocA family protein n=1 Tax=Ottowia flava TaxID=2675430 RepID=A0ABW4KTF6_9BURK|nr:Gfo/Idh/MocA family oxidoreductase [Ottowia sp. GY511]TXK33375.1 Gfo/Idh/MocA family oxidoreductase [Ottowia sp. GY511]
MSAVADPIRLGVLGLGRAFTLMLPTFLGDARVQLVAAFDPHAEARAAFERTFHGNAADNEEAVCADPNVEWVYIATPHQLHARHVQLAARYGKHVLVEKPLALSLADADAMVDACARAGTRLIVGHSHSFNAPVLQARELIASGRYGAVRMVHALQYTDFLYRPRRPEELDTRQGGGVVFSQAAHQVDTVRLLAGGLATSVRALMGRWDPDRPTEGAYSALLQFAGGALASLSYNGYGFYDSDRQMDGVGEMGTPKAPDAHQATRARLTAASSEAAEVALKAARNFGGSAFAMPTPSTPTAAQHFGPVIVSCDHADLRLTPTGVEITSQAGAEFVPVVLPHVPRAEVIDELWGVAREGNSPLHSGEWSRATLEVCLAMLQSEAAGTDIALERQVAAPA